METKTIKRGKRKLTDEVIEKVYHLAAAGGTKSLIAGALGIKRDTFYKWMNDEDDPRCVEFAAQFNKGEAEAMEKCTRLIMNKIVDGDVESAKWFLSRRDKDNYSAQLNQQMTAAIDINKIEPISLTFLTAADVITDEERISGFLTPERDLEIKQLRESNMRESNED